MNLRAYWIKLLLVTFLALAVNNDALNYNRKSYIDSLRACLTEIQSGSYDYNTGCARELMIAYINTDLDSVLYYYKLDLQFAEEANDLLKEAELKIWLGDAYRDYGHYANSIKYLKKGLTIITKNKLPAYLGAFCYWNIGFTYSNEGIYDSALYYFNNSLLLFKETLRNHYDNRFNNRYIWSYLGIANVYLTLGNMDSVYSVLSKVDRTYQEIETGFVEVDIANIYYEIGEVHKALYYYNRVIEKIKSDKYKSYEVIGSYLETGRFLFEGLHNYNSALAYYEKALINARENDDILKEIEILLALGDLHKAIKIDSIPLRYYERSRYLAEKSSNYIYLIKADQKLADFFIQDNRYSQGLDLYKKAIDISEKTGAEPVSIELYLDLAEVYLELQEYDTVGYYIFKGITQAELLGNHRYLTIGFNKLGKLYYARKQYQAAIKYFKEALEHAGHLKNYQIAKESAYSLYESFNETKQYQNALNYFQVFKKFEDSLNIIEKERNLANLEMHFELEKINRQNQLKLEEIKMSSEIKVKRQKLIIAYALAGILFLIMFVSVLYRNYKRKKRDNDLLQTQKAEIEKQKNQIESMAQKVHQADEMKINFFTNISHELRTPLTLIIGHAEELLHLKKINELTRSKITSIRKNAGKLIVMVNQLLDLRKLEDGKIQIEAVYGNVVDAIIRIVSSLESLANQKDVAIEINNSEEVISGYFDPTKYETILVNLLTNAIKFSKSNDLIHVKIEKDGNSFIILTVMDSGIGIPEEQLEYIFEPFFQASNNKYGSGIGLALTKELVELMSGTIHVVSELNRGSCFRVRLPVTKELLGKAEIVTKEDIITTQSYEKELYLDSLAENHTITNEEDNVTSSLLKNEINEKSLLIVEDNPELRNFIKDAFKNSYRIYVAPNGKIGYDLAMSKIPDIIISDIMMPEMDGSELCRELKKQEKTSHIPVILLTAKAGDDNLIAGFKTGADDYITKPFSIEVLKVRILNIIKNREKLYKKFSREISIQPEEIACNSPDRSFLKRARYIIETNMDDMDFDIEVFVERMKISRAHLYRKLKALTNLSVKEFIRIIRLKKAVELLIENSYTVAEISYKVGFSSPSYFTKCFKQQFGTSPKNFVDNLSARVNSGKF
ncbi:MAG: response regulator [Bacteroidales bacterium]|nr:response regulator [Bacteroidales bacterium]